MAPCSFVVCFSLLAAVSTFINCAASLDPLSCHDKCGKIQLMPCACDNRCLIHSNCCEDMDIECPEIIDESKLKFANILHSRIECNQDGVFVVTSCPEDTTMRSENREEPVTDSPALSTKEDNVSHNSTGDLSSTIAENHTFQTQHDENSSTSRPASKSATLSINELRKRVLLTDTSTGFVFKNQTIFNCHATSKSKPMMWDISIPTKNTFSPRHLGDLLDAVNSESMLQYVPPADTSVHLIGARCRPDSISHCGEEGVAASAGDNEDVIKNGESIAQNAQEAITNAGGGATNAEGVATDVETMTMDAELRNKCETGSIAYVENFYTRLDLYKNKYCLECNLGVNTSFRPVENLSPPRNFREFSLLLSLSNSDLKIKPGTGPSADKIHWKSVKCDLTSQSHDEEGSECLIDRCASNYELRADNQCRKRLQVTFAIPDDDDYYFTQSDLETLPHFVKCQFEQNLNIEITKSSSVISTVYDVRLNTLLHMLDFELFWEGETILQSYKFSETTRNLMAVAKAFKEDRIRHSSIMANGSVIESTNDVINDKNKRDEGKACHDRSTFDAKSNAILCGFPQYESVEWKSKMKGNESRVPMTIACFCSYSLATANDCTLRCFPDDMSSDSEQEEWLVSLLLNTSCPSEGQEMRRGKGSRNYQPQWAEFFIILVFAVVFAH